MRSAPKKQGDGTAHRLDFLDGVRALAALFVIMHHIYISTGGQWQHGLKGLELNWFIYGHLAVDVFIVLSGFCLMLPVAKRGVLKDGAIEFYRRRAWRILPPFFASILFALALRLCYQAPPADYSSAPLKMWSVNLFLLQDILPGHNSINEPLWSVAVEWKIYFLFPLLVLVWSRSRLGRLPGAIPVLALTALIGYGLTFLLNCWRPWMELDHTCPWYVFLFGMGLCAGGASVRDNSIGTESWWRDRWALSACGALILVCVILKIAYPLNVAIMPVLDPAVGALTATTLFLLARAQRQGRRPLGLALLSWRPLVVIGTFAYSIYLVHNPLLMAVEITMARFHIGSHWLFGTTLLIALPVIVGLCYLFFLAFERPFLKRRRKETMSELARDAVASPAP